MATITAVPTPDSTQQEVRQWLHLFFKRLHDDQAALEQAEKCNYDGEHLYAASEKELIELWKISGSIIYHRIQNSEYGRTPNFWTYQPIYLGGINFICTLLGVVTFFKDSYKWPIISTAISFTLTAILIIAQNHCASTPYLTNPNRSNRFKARLFGAPNSSLWDAVQAWKTPAST
ncbi:MAG: hypothetical protein Q9209_007466 [Squamulea sp. 1 TL-2023]